MSRLIGRQTVDVEDKDRQVIAIQVGAVEGDAFDVGETVAEPARVAHLMFEDLLDPTARGNPLLCGQQTRHSHEIHGSELHSPGVRPRVAS